MSFDGHGRPGDARFCTEHSLAAGEPLAGWGGHQARNVLIRWPKARWRHSLRIAAGMDGAVENAVERVFAAGWRVNLIDRKPYQGDLVRAFLMPDALAFDLEPGELPEFLDAVPKGRPALDGFGPCSMTEPLILCCTHGRHDRCCAKWGYAVYKALAAEAARIGRFDVWEATHLGGCRLSAGVLTMPAMRKYGRMAPADAAPLLDAEREGRPYLPCYRGASALPAPAQAAEVAGLRQLATNGHVATARVHHLGADEAAQLYRVTANGRSVDIRCTSRDVASYGACADLDDGAPVEPRIAWDAECA